MTTGTGPPTGTTATDARWWRRLNWMHGAWIHAKVAIAAWAVLLVFYTPRGVQDALNTGLVWAIAALTITGAAASIVGLILSARVRGDRLPRKRVTHGLMLELVGLLWMLLGGAGTYWITQVGLVINGDDQRIALAAFAYTLCAFMLARVVMIRHQRRKEAERSKGTPAA